MSGRRTSGGFMSFKNKDVRGIAAQIAPEDGDEVWFQDIDQREHYHAGADHWRKARRRISCLE